MAERQAADLGANGMGRLVQSRSRRRRSVQVAEDVAGIAVRAEDRARSPRR